MSNHSAKIDSNVGEKRLAASITSGMIERLIAPHGPYFLFGLPLGFRRRKPALPPFFSMNSAPAEFDVAFSAVSLTAETIGFVLQKRSPLASSHRLGFAGFRRRTPGPPPFSSINSTPADSKARRIARSFAAVSEVSSIVNSARRIVVRPTDE